MTMYKSALELRIEELLAENAQLRAEGDRLRPNAERYKWLRSQYWDTSVMCVVKNPKQKLKLGSDCPSFERLDETIDTFLTLNKYITCIGKDGGQ